MDEVKDHRKKAFQVFLALAAALIIVSVLTVVFTNTDKKAINRNTEDVTLAPPIVRPRFITGGLNSPTGIYSTSDSSDKRIFVLERSGTIRTISSSYQLQDKAFLDISSKVLGDSEMGLLGLAFHPNYSQNGFFYINYIDKNQNTIIARYKVLANDFNTADPGSEKILFTVKQPYTNHNGGALLFGPDGYLYAALGDGGSGGDPENRAQDKNSYFGKILRLDVNSGDTYSVPTSNPFVGQPNVKPEIWAYGLRNPWRISFDSATGELYIADVGQGKLEEVDVQPATSKGGENYGWRCYEGSQAFRLDGCGAASSYISPIFDYTHDEGRCSITGGYVYRGSESPALVGKYFYGDYCSGDLFYTANNNGHWEQTLAVKTPFNLSTFGQDSSKELYFADFKSGSIYKLEDINN